MASVNKKSPSFLPRVYKLTPGSSPSSATLYISGQKIGVPNKRIALSQKGLRVSSAQITYRQKNKQIEHQIVRINHLPTFEEVRLHTAGPLYPGSYEISLEFEPADIEAISALVGKPLEGVELRRLFPSFDSPQSRTDAQLEVES